MQFDFFKTLSPKETNAFLRRFLEVESLNIKGTIKQCAARRMKMDYSIKSIPRFMRWVLTNLNTTTKEPDPAVPEWLRNNEVYTKNLFDFDEQSGILVTRAGYYLGESFVRSHGNLRWGIGDIKTADANMPVVTGFANGMEMPPVIVADNLLATVIDEPDRIGKIEDCIGYWNSMV